MHVLQQVKKNRRFLIMCWYLIGIFFSELRYPETVSRFRCPVCDTVNDLKAHIRSQIANEPLTLRQLKRCASKCSIKHKAAQKDSAEELDPKELERLYEPVEKLVETAFGSWVCLNHSFTNVILERIYKKRY